MGKFNTQKSNEYNKKLKTVLAGGVHYSFRMPWEAKQIHFVKGKGTRAWDMDGNEYLDFFSKFGANILGHNNSQYNESIIKALEKISSTNLSDIEYEVAEMICKYVASAEMVRFSLSGTEAVQNALRLARGYTKKNKFIRFFIHYHGNADNILGGKVGDLSNPVPVEFQGDFNDTEGKAEHILQEQSFLLPWNDLNALDYVITNHHNEIAAIIMEPICINGGGVMPNPGYLEGVRQLCDKYGVVLIFDEMITGFRVGLGGAQQLFGVTPDITTLGKAMAGGALPVSAIVGKREIMKLYEDRKVTHGGTFNGYPLGMTAVKSTLEILSEDNGKCYESMNNHMERIHNIFLNVAQENGISFEMKGANACGVYHLVQEEENISPKERMIAQYINKFVSEAMVENGILISNLNRFYGNISVNDEDVNLFEQRIKEVFQAVSGFITKARG